MSTRPLPKRVLVGRDEDIFFVLPEDIILNFLSEGSENALLWNMFYTNVRDLLTLGRSLTFVRDDSISDCIKNCFFLCDLCGKKIN